MKPYTEIWELEFMAYVVLIWDWTDLGEGLGLWDPHCIYDRDIGQK